MTHSPTGLGHPRTPDPVNEPIPQAPSAAPPVDGEAAEVLISTQKVLFGTAAAVGTRRARIGSRLAAPIRRLFATSTEPSRPRTPYYPRQYGFLEDALMSREMDRL
jgi:hypothetical protein